MTPDAVRVALYYASLGPGEHAYDRDDLSFLLEEGGDKRIAKALGRAVKCGHLTRHRGGQHTDRFSFSPSQAEGESAVSPPQAAGESPPMVEGDGDALTPIIPLRSVSADAEEAIDQHGDRFKGFRDAMRDYLRKRVPPTEHRAIVQTVATWLSGFGFNWRGYGGAPIPVEHHAGLLAATFNEISATDEKLYKYPPGDIRNVKTKLGVLCQDWGKPARAATGTDGGGRGGKRDQPQDAQEYRYTPYQGLKG